MNLFHHKRLIFFSFQPLMVHNPKYLLVHSEGWSNEQTMSYIKEHNIVCPNCGKSNFTDVRQFKLMFETHMGVVEDDKSVVYLRPETAQGIFVNFKNIQRTSRKKVPFGIGQIGKPF